MGTHTICLSAEAVAASTAYVLVDLSDTTNFPHLGTDHLYLQKLILNTEKAGDGVYDIWIGVITEVDATNGTAEWIQCFHLESVHNATDSTDRFSAEMDFSTLANPDGMDLTVNAATAGSETLRFVLTNSSQAGNTNWQTDTGLASPAGAAAGATGKPGAGDLVMWVEEVSGTGTIDFFITAIYSAT
jgi:hypothetical protein